MRPVPSSLASVTFALAACRAATPPTPPTIANVAAPSSPAVWIYRELATGAAVKTSRLETYRLVVDAGQATLAVTRAATDASADLMTPCLTGWHDRDVEQDHEYVSGEFVFGADPGLEYLYVNDDCTQGGGLRRIAPDGAVAPIRF